MDRYAYYVCFKCGKAYFGGEARCDLDAGAGDAFNPEELVCGGCSDVSQAQMCPKHGTDYLEYKVCKSIKEECQVLFLPVPLLLQRGSLLLLWNDTLLQCKIQIFTLSPILSLTPSFRAAMMISRGWQIFPRPSCLSARWGPKQLLWIKR